jgi:hypothetical protein
MRHGDANEVPESLLWTLLPLTSFRTSGWNWQLFSAEGKPYGHLLAIVAGREWQEGMVSCPLLVAEKKQHLANGQLTKRLTTIR